MIVDVDIRKIKLRLKYKLTNLIRPLINDIMGIRPVYCVYCSNIFLAILVFCKLGNHKYLVSLWSPMWH